MKVLRKPTFIKTRHKKLFCKEAINTSKYKVWMQRILLINWDIYFFTCLKTKLLFCKISFPFMTNQNFSSPDLILNCPAVLKAMLHKVINEENLTDLSAKLQYYKLSTNDLSLSLFYWHFPASLTQKIWIKFLEASNLVPLKVQTACLRHSAPAPLNCSSAVWSCPGECPILLPSQHQSTEKSDS